MCQRTTRGVQEAHGFRLVPQQLDREVARRDNQDIDDAFADT
jgi:hypothetical protein